MRERQRTQVPRQRERNIPPRSREREPLVIPNQGKAKIEYIAIADLKPYERNVRTHPETQIKQIMKSMQTYGFTQPVLIDEKNMILAGHGRCMAAKRLGIETAPCIRLTGLSKAQKEAYILADNKIAMNSGWDEDALAAILKEGVEGGFDVSVTGFGDKEVEYLLSNIDALDAKTETKMKPMEELSGEDDESITMLKPDIKFKSDDEWDVPMLKSDMLMELPKNVELWAREDATTDDGKKHFLYLWGSTPIHRPPSDRTFVGFYIDDEKFELFWDEPDVYVGKLLQAGVMGSLTPNYSLWKGWPRAIQLYNIYRARWVGRYMQESGLPVIPDVQPVDDKSLEYCMKGIPKNPPCIAMELQTMSNKQIDIQRQTRLIREVYRELRPEAIMVYGGDLAQRVFAGCNLKCRVQFVAPWTEVRWKAMEKKKKAQQAEGKKK